MLARILRIREYDNFIAFRIAEIIRHLFDDQLIMVHKGRLHTVTQHLGAHADKIYERVWQAPSLNTTTIRRHLSTLRQKLKEVSHENLVVTEFGKGYAFVAEGKNL